MESSVISGVPQGDFEGNLDPDPQISRTLISPLELGRLGHSVGSCLCPFIPDRIFGNGSRWMEGDKNAFGGGDGSANLNVTDLLMRLNLTEEEEAVWDFSDDEGDDDANKK